MTENELRKKVANWLVQFVGITQGSSAHKTILSTFNNSKLCTRYTMTVNDAWCATATSAAFIANGLAGKSGSGSLFECCECSCYYMIELAKKQGIWVENDAYVPKVGDIIMYDWQDDGSGDNQGVPDHVGIVFIVNGNSFRVIEGNISKSVGYRDMNVNGKYIRGFITPNYSKFATSTTSNTNKPTNNSIPNISYVGKGIGVATALTAIYIRNGAISSCSAYGTIEKGERVEVLEKLSNGWYKIVWAGASCGYAYTSNAGGKYYSYVSNKSTEPNKTRKWVGKVTATLIDVKSWAGTEYSNIKSYPQLGKDNLIDVCDTVKDSKGNDWYYVLIANKYYGFVHSAYIQRV